jgi:hypothetical protein
MTEQDISTAALQTWFREGSQTRRSARKSRR